MKPITYNRRLKLLVWLLVLVIIVMLLIPSELTYVQLAQIQPGMTLEKVKERLGSPVKETLDLGVLHTSPDGFHGKITIKRKFWKPTIDANFNGFSATNKLSIWIGENHLLWVEHQDGIVVKTCLFPITRTGGGIQGCFDTLKDYWNQWRK